MDGIKEAAHKGEMHVSRSAVDTLFVQLSWSRMLQSMVPTGAELQRQLGAKSGDMQKRAGLARAMALAPDILFFDEPSAGLDPISTRRLDELILELRDSLGATVVVVTHELASMFTIGNYSVFLDPETKTMIAQNDSKALRDTCPDPKVREFFSRGEAKAAYGSAHSTGALVGPRPAGR